MILWRAEHYSDTLNRPTDLVQKAKEDRDALIRQLMNQIAARK